MRDHLEASAIMVTAVALAGLFLFVLFMWPLVVMGVMGIGFVAFGLAYCYVNILEDIRRGR